MLNMASTYRAKHKCSPNDRMFEPLPLLKFVDPPHGRILQTKSIPEHLTEPPSVWVPVMGDEGSHDAGRQIHDLSSVLYRCR